ncbi:MAG: beta-ketoacyl-ACP synthase III [Desulfuromonadales bacterium]
MILGTGLSVPEKILTNRELEKVVDTSDKWIKERTGIEQRHVAEPGTGVSRFAAEAANRALADAGISASELDFIIVATVTGDYKFPSTACLVQDLIGAAGATAFDLSAACSGVVYSLQVADSLIRAGAARHILVIGAEVLTSMVNWQDRDTCVLFGDGAGAFVLAPSKDGRGIMSVETRSDGSLSELLINPGCGSVNPPTVQNVSEQLHTIRMKGREVFRNAVSSMTRALNTALDQAGVDAAQLDLLIPHQANMRIIDAVSRNFEIDPDCVYKNVARYGNTSAASIPIALDEARREGRVGEGSLIGLVTFGAGLTWGAAILRL